MLLFLFLSVLVLRMLKLEFSLLEPVDAFLEPNCWLFLSLGLLVGVVVPPLTRLKKNFMSSVRRLLPGQNSAFTSRAFFSTV
jgi:hypothetical protein